LTKTIDVESETALLRVTEEETEVVFEEMLGQYVFSSSVFFKKLKNNCISFRSSTTFNMFLLGFIKLSTRSWLLETSYGYCKEIRVKNTIPKENISHF
jgi:hypothetical protein